VPPPQLPITAFLVAGPDITYFFDRQDDEPHSGPDDGISFKGATFKAVERDAVLRLNEA